MDEGKMYLFFASLSAIIGFGLILLKAAAPTPTRCLLVAIYALIPLTLYAIADYNGAPRAILPCWALSLLWLGIMAMSMLQRASLLDQ